MNVEKQARKKVLREYRLFKRRFRYRKTFGDLWEACGQVHFYSTVKEYFELNEKIPKVYLELIMKEERPLAAMWETYLSEDYLRYQTWEEIEEILEAMLIKWKLPMAG